MKTQCDDHHRGGLSGSHVGGPPTLSSEAQRSCLGGSVPELDVGKQTGMNQINQTKRNEPHWAEEQGTDQQDSVCMRVQRRSNSLGCEEVLCPGNGGI